MDWGEAVDEMQRELGMTDDRTKERDPLKLAQLMYIYNKVRYGKLLNKIINLNGKPSCLHKALFELHPEIIITTNWDDLLEKAADEQIFPQYDCISCDTELVKSDRSYKIIKMHGDLSHNNTVFKEEDYMNYNENYPLIESFVRNVIATKAIIFLGYSYNDITLKQITNWVNRNADERLPMYLVTMEYSFFQEEYLQSWGIRPVVLDNLCLPDEGGNKPELTDNRSRKIYTFLKHIKDLNTDLKTMMNSADFFYNLLSPLDGINSVLLFTLEKILKPFFSIFYESNGPWLVAHQFSSIMPNRNMGEELVFELKMIENNDAAADGSKQLMAVKSILIKAGIRGLRTQRFNEPIDCVLKQDEYQHELSDIEDYLSFAKVVSSVCGKEVATPSRTAWSYMLAFIFARANSRFCMTRGGRLLS